MDTLVDELRMLTQKHREIKKDADRKRKEQEEQKMLRQIEEAKQFVPKIYSMCLAMARGSAKNGLNIAGVDIWTDTSPSWCGPGENDYTKEHTSGLCTTDKDISKTVAEEVVKLLKSQNPGLQADVTFWGQRYFTTMQITMHW